MRQHFLPRAERKYAPKDTPKRFMVGRSHDYPMFNYRRTPIEKPPEKTFRRKQRRKAGNRFWAINAAFLGCAFARNIHDVSSRIGFTRRMMEKPEERTARLAQELATWKERFLAEQRYLVPRLHPKNMVKPEQLFTGGIGRIEGFNFITDAFMSGESTKDSGSPTGLDEYPIV